MPTSSDRRGRRGAAATTPADEEGEGRVAKDFEEKQVANEEEQEEEQEEEEEACSEAYIRRVSGEEDLAAVHNLALTVDTHETQVTLPKVDTAALSLCTQPTQ